MILIRSQNMSLGLLLAKESVIDERQGLGREMLQEILGFYSGQSQNLWFKIVRQSKHGNSSRCEAMILNQQVPSTLFLTSGS